MQAPQAMRYLMVEKQIIIINTISFSDMGQHGSGLDLPPLIWIRLHFSTFRGSEFKSSFLTNYTVPSVYSFADKKNTT
jgi:hypothetical protein